MERTFDLAITDPSPHNDLFWAACAEPGFVVLVGSKSIVRVESEGIKLGTKFLNVHGTLVREHDVAEYNDKRQRETVKQLRSLTSYSQLAKKKKQNKRR